VIATEERPWLVFVDYAARNVTNEWAECATFRAVTSTQAESAARAWASTRGRIAEVRVASDGNYQIELANGLRGGNEWVATRRPRGYSMILARFATREAALEWIDARPESQAETPR
jgi:hypothetical protein